MPEDNKDEKPIPPIDKSLLQALDDLFPEQSAEVDWNMNHVMFKAGQRSVIRFLHSKCLSKYSDEYDTTFVISDHKISICCPSFFNFACLILISKSKQPVFVFL